MLVFHAWLDSEFFFPMTKRDIQLIQEKIGAYPDGVWGPMSRAACQKHLDRLRPVPVQWPMQDDQSLIAFYGQPGDESNLVNLSVADLGVHYEGQAVKSIRCHTRVASSLHRVLTAISKTHPYVLKQYAGCYNDRNMRGGSRKSLHAWGAAIDLMAGSNGNNTVWPTDASMPLEVMEYFADEGWLSGGAYWSRDSMHFQATR
jgi:hypothetical protein